MNRRLPGFPTGWWSRRAPHSGPARFSVSPGEVGITYWGTAAVTIEAFGTTLVVDPNVTRPGVVGTFLRPLVPDDARIARTFPSADAVLVTHAHHDHVLDAPSLCLRTGARLLGSSSVCNVGRAAGVSEEYLLEVTGGDTVSLGPYTVQAIRSRHGTFLGRAPLPGAIASPPSWPPRVRELRHGEVLCWLIEVAGVRIFHIGTANFVPEAVRGLRADIVLLCAVGRRSCPGYTARLVGELRPRSVIPIHWDILTRPLDVPLVPIPGVDLRGLFREVRAFGAEPVLLRAGERFVLPE